MEQDTKSVSSNDYIVINNATGATKPKLVIKDNCVDDFELRLNEALNSDLNTPQMDELKSCNNDNEIQQDSIINDVDDVVDDDDDEQQPYVHRTLSMVESQNCSLFFNITYLGCASVNAPRSDTEVSRIISTLNNQQTHLDVIMSIPNTIDDYIQLFDSTNQLEISTYKMSQVLFVVRGTRVENDEKCFAFTTCHGNSIENLIFTCHVFRCELNEAVNKVLHSFFTVFKKQNQSTHQSETTTNRSSSVNTEHSADTISLNSVAATTPSSNVNISFADQVLKYVNGDVSSQFIYRIQLEIKEDFYSNNKFENASRVKEFFKLHKNLDKLIQIQIQQLTNKHLEIQRCFGVLLSAGRNCNVADMQLLETKSMGNMITSQNEKSYQVSAHWNPREPSFSTLNEETPKDYKVFLTIAIDLVIDCVLEPVRFYIETKARILPQTEKVWFAARNVKLTEDFYVQLKMNAKQEYHLDSIYSQTELKRKLNVNELDVQKQKQLSECGSTANGSNLDDSNDYDDDNDLVFSGMGIVSKDFLNEDELSDWTELMQRWRKNYTERPRGLQQLVHKGIPESLRGEVWQLLAGCTEDEKSMHESYRLLLYKESASEQVIIRDINRTFPGHQYFQDENGQQALYKLSKAYSIYDQEIGYCQGLSFLVATLLLHMPEEQSFSVLVKIMHRYQLRDIYKTNFESLHLRFFQLDMLIHDMLPSLYEHFLDLNIETHMYASQWFLTLYTAKFPLYMVYRIIDLFLYEGFNVIFSIGLALLKASQKDLLMLDFEGVLKYFRVQMPKKYRNEQNLKELMTIWQTQVHPKINDKKLKKYEKNYIIFKEIEIEKEDPLIRSDKKIKKLTQQMRRLELENEDLANEYIDSRINLSKQLDETKDLNENLKVEVAKLKQDLQFKYDDYTDTISKYQTELDTIKQLWRHQIEKYEYEIDRQNIILNEYKQICNKLSNKLEVFTNFKKDLSNYLFKLNQMLDLNDKNINLKSLLSEITSEFQQSQLYLSVFDESVLESITSANNNNSNNNIHNKIQENESSTNDHDHQMNKIKELELELARVKLELVNEQCKNQEFNHKFKQLLNNVNTPQMTNNEQLNNNSSSGSGGSSGNNGTRWLSKTLTQFKEATNQVVQKVKTTTSDN